MNMENKRIHGRLLMATGFIHILFVLIPGVYGETFYQFMSSSFFNINDGLADFPFIGGTLNHKDFTAFWFFYAGALIFMYGYLLDELEAIHGYVPINQSIAYLIVSGIGAYMIPLSGMTFILMPQGIYMYLRAKKVVNVKS
jgi:hypothetical protein